MALDSSYRSPVFLMSTRDRWRIEHAVTQAAAEPNKHVRLTVVHAGKEYRVVVYERRNERAILAERDAAATH